MSSKQTSLVVTAFRDHSFGIYASAILIAYLAFNLKFNDFDLGVWTFDYSHGFIKRGMAGEILSTIIEKPYSNHDLANVFIFIYSIFAILLFYFLNLGALTKSTALALFASGFMIQQIGYTVEKLDAILLVISLAGLVVIHKLDIRYSMPVCTLLITTALLIHEASAMLVVPLIVSIFFIKERASNNFPTMSGILLIISIFSFSTIYYLHGLTDVSQTILTEMGKAKIPTLTDDNLAFKIYNLSLIDNMNWALERLHDPKTLTRTLLNIAAGLPFILLFVSFYLQLKDKSSWFWLPFIMVIGASACMYLLGIDFSRWNAWIMMNTTLFLTASALILSCKLKTSRYIIIAAWIFLLWSGPFGITISLPQRNSLIQSFIDIF